MAVPSDHSDIVLSHFELVRLNKSLNKLLLDLDEFPNPLCFLHLFKGKYAPIYYKIYKT